MMFAQHTTLAINPIAQRRNPSRFREDKPFSRHALSLLPIISHIVRRRPGKM
jgi:hypothetical protein